jgi:hypothetical protein
MPGELQGSAACTVATPVSSNNWRPFVASDSVVPETEAAVSVVPETEASVSVASETEASDERRFIVHPAEGLVVDLGADKATSSLGRRYPDAGNGLTGRETSQTWETADK